ncbi:MAG: nuclear transport factor 2 family protein [Streptosporangiaceae bacterium]
MSDFRAVADRVEIEALRGEFTDAVMMRDYDPVGSLSTPDGALRMPNVPVELTGREEIRVWGERVPDLVDYFVQTTHLGVSRLDGDTASGRAYMSELLRMRDGPTEVNYAICHDHYRRTPDGWKFTERVYEVRYRDTAPLAGAAPSAPEGARSHAGRNSAKTTGSTIVGASIAGDSDIGEGLEAR